MSSDKLEDIYQLLTQHNFDENKNVPDEFKCGKCRKILNKACQTRCGCRFCRSCVDEMMNNGCQFCPGITNNCRIGLLSTAQLDYRANNQISMLRVKCPKEMCSYECELSEMREHLRIENYNHNKILIDMIENIKNEVKELREKEMKNSEEINKFKTDLQSKDEEMKSINAEIEMLKMEKLEMEKRLESVEENRNLEIGKLRSEHEKEMQSIKTEKKELDLRMEKGLKNIWYKIEEIELKMKNRSENGKIESIKSELIEKIEILQRDFNNKIDEIESITKKEIKSINDEIRLKIKENSKQTIDKSIMEYQLKMNGTFEWIIDNVYELRNEYFGGICSEYFYARMHPYKLRLRIYPLVDELWIYLCIYDDVENQYLPFPFTADVTIKTINGNQKEINKAITKYCQIEKPETNSYNTSDVFIYSKSELIESGILESYFFNYSMLY